MTTTRFRLRFPFWLDMHKPEEAALADTIQDLKDQRAFASSIRDGLRLIVDLRAGRLDVLIELFPWIAERLQSSQKSSNDDDLKAHITRLERLLLQQASIPAPPPNYPAMKPLAAGQGGMRQMNVPKVDLPRFDDDDDDIVLNVTRREDSEEDLAQISQNFMASFLNVVGQ